MRELAIRIKDISIHALREEGDFFTAQGAAWSGHFYPRPPRGGRPKRSHLPCAGDNFYPRPPRGGRLSLVRKLVKGAEFLSTPSARRATAALDVAHQPNDISIHALREEGDLSVAFWVFMALVFLSTPSARRATVHLVERGKPRVNFYPRPPRGGRRTLCSGSSSDC